MSDALAQGILLGGLYAAIALGLSLIFGIMNILNLAHGGFIVLGAYTIFTCQSYFGINPMLGLLITAVFTYLLGYVIYRWGGVSRVSSGPSFMAIALTFGFNLIFISAIENFFSNDSQKIDLAPSMYAQFSILGVHFTAIQLYIAIAALVMTLSVNGWIMHTKTGRSIRAVRQDKDIAGLNGVRVPHANGIAFGVGTAMAAISGAFLTFVGSFTPQSGEAYLTTAFAVAIIGGLGNINSIIAAGFLFGVVSNVTSFALGSVYGNAISLFILLIILLIRPQGLFGSEYY